MELPQQAILGSSAPTHPLAVHSGNQSLSVQALAVSISALASICHAWAPGQGCALLACLLSTAGYKL